MSGNTCTIQGHEGQPILAVCVYEQCKKTRAVCFLCMQQNQHMAHPGDLKQIQQIDAFLNPKRQQFGEIRQRVDDIQQQFNHSVNYLRTIVTEHYQPPNNFNGMGNKQIDETIGKLTQYNQIQKLMSDRLDNIFRNTLEQIKTTCYDLSSPSEKECFDLFQTGNNAVAKTKIDALLVKNPKNTLMMLLKAEILRNENLFIDSAEVYARILTIDPNNPWAIQGRKLAQQRIQQ